MHVTIDKVVLVHVLECEHDLVEHIEDLERRELLLAERLPLAHDQWHFHLDEDKLVRNDPVAFNLHDVAVTKLRERLHQLDGLASLLTIQS